MLPGVGEREIRGRQGEAAKDKWCKIVFIINLDYNSNVF